MNYGFHLATGGVLQSMRRMDVLANNLSNASTVGFKPDFVTTRERPAERIEGQYPLSDPTALPQELLERLGGGIRFDADRINLTQGSIERTQSPTDIALKGEGFFVLADANDRAPSNRAPVDLTRDGTFVLDTNGTFRRSGDGRAILGEDGRPITIDTDLPFQIDDDGRVMQDGSEVARIRIVRPKDPASLRKLGGNLLRAPAVERVPEGKVNVMQMAREESVVDPIHTMVEMMRQSRLLEANVRMLQYQDSLNGQAINGIARNA